MQSNEEKQRIQQLLKGMFSKESDETIRTVCETNQWNAENCIDCLVKNDSTGAASANRNNNGAVPKSKPKNIKTDQRYYNNMSQADEEIVHALRAGYRVMIILRGPPGCGKSCLARLFVKKTVRNFDEYCWKDFIFSTDSYFYDQVGRYHYKMEKLSEAHEYNKNRVYERAKLGWSPIIIDNTNMKIWEMVPYIQIAVQNGYRVHITEPKNPWNYSPDILASKNSHGVPRDKIQLMLMKYESATLSDIFKSMNITWNVVPLKRNFPPLESKDLYVKKECNVNNVQQNVLQESTLNNMAARNKISADTIGASKEQRNYFAKRNMPAAESEKAHENSLNAEENLLERISNSVSDSKYIAVEEAKRGSCAQGAYDNQTVESLSEQYLLVLLRQVCPNKPVTEFKDLFRECNGNIEKAVDILLNQRVLCLTKTLTQENEDEIDLKLSLSNQSTGVKQQREEKDTKKDYSSNRSALLNFHLQFDDKGIVEQEAASDENQHRSRHGLYSAIFGSAHEFVDASTQTDIFKENYLNYVLSGYEMVGIDFCGKLIAQRAATYWPENREAGVLSFQERICDSDFLSKTLAKDLYMLCMVPFYNKMKAESKPTKLDDGSFINLIPELKYENLEVSVKYVGNSKLSFHIYGMDKDNKKKFQTLEVVPLDLAIHLALFKLIDEHAANKHQTLLDILRAHQNSYKETVKLLLECNVNREMESQKNTPQYKGIFVDPENKEIIDSKGVPISEADAKRFALTKFEETRNFAAHHCQLKGECYQKAKDMIQKGNSAVAVFFSQIATLHTGKTEAYNQIAANSMINVQKYSKENPDLLDLHYLHLVEAICCLDIYLDRHISDLRDTAQPHKDVFVITGRGLHSIGGISIIKNYVKNRLKDRNLRWTEMNPGLLKVKLYFTSRYAK